MDVGTQGYNSINGCEGTLGYNSQKIHECGHQGTTLREQMDVGTLGYIKIKQVCCMNLAKFTCFIIWDFKFLLIFVNLY